MLQNKFAHSTNKDKTSSGLLLGDLMPKEILEKFNLVKTSKKELTKLSSYDIWLENKNLELATIRNNYHDEFSYFVACGRKYGILNSLISCNGLYFDESPGKRIHDYKMGWFFNTNIYSFPCIVLRKKEKLKLSFDKRVVLSDIKEFKNFRYPLFNKGIFSLLPEGLENLQIVGDVMNRGVGLGFRFLPSNFSCHFRAINGEYFYFFPVCDTEFYSKEIGLDSFDNWELIY